MILQLAGRHVAISELSAITAASCVSVTLSVDFSNSVYIFMQKYFFHCFMLTREMESKVIKSHGFCISGHN